MSTGTVFELVTEAHARLKSRYNHVMQQKVRDYKPGLTFQEYANGRILMNARETQLARECSKRFNYAWLVRDLRDAFQSMGERRLRPVLDVDDQNQAIIRVIIPE